ncbi:MAG TPA: hypothetical protein VF951_17980 [Streptosporangiaceae bacterium]
MVTAISPPRSRPGLGLGAGLVAAARGLAFCGLMLAGLGCCWSCWRRSA